MDVASFKKQKKSQSRLDYFYNT